MRVEVIMPQMGESIVEGTVVEWLKSVGDTVKRDEDIFVLSTDKVDAEVPSPTDGVLVEILAQPGDTVEVGAVVAWVETDAAAASAGPAPAEEAPAKTDTQAPAATPTGGQKDAKDAAATPAGTKKDAKDATETTSHARPGSAGPSRDELRRVRSTPLVRRIAAEHGIEDLTSIEGTGISGRVTKKDILAFIEKGGPAPSAGSPTVAIDRDVPAGYRVALEKVPRVHVYDSDRVEPMSRMRKSIVENMMQARRTTAHCHTVWEADVTGIVRARRSLRDEYAARGARLTFTPFFVAAVVQGLREWPLMNAAIDGDSIVYRSQVNIGVAAAIDEGLIVPVVKGADGLNLLGIAKAVNDLGERARTKSLKPADVADGTFTISNAGVFGSLFGIPILVQPQVGILGIGGIKKRVAADENDNIRVRSFVTMCLTFDHRLIDGETADGFMRTVTQALESASMT